MRVPQLEAVSAASRTSGVFKSRALPTRPRTRRFRARSGPAHAALAFYPSPGFAVLFGTLLLRESLTPVALFGLVAIVVGVA
ncbi:EamA family transporter [Microbispora sp. NBC_01389]|uniref:EamA family transporter n=1 Tax=Microbispora sp. NBC_01389 TaxID=2903584 RepID=UPI003248A1D9